MVGGTELSVSYFGLYTSLTVFPWPVESRNSSAACGCDTQCPGPCFRKTLAYGALEDAGTDKRCE